MTLSFLNELENIIGERIGSASETSYIARLVASGRTRVAQKVGEEAIELALAAVSGSRVEQINEAADLLFHFQVLLTTLDLSLADIVSCLEERHRD
jgi:phosphoribosyl-ATP pyrophosphohydrolase/phosphoribosyl-AMP cyclohydrolase